MLIIVHGFHRILFFACVDLFIEAVCKLKEYTEFISYFERLQVI